jgi:group I intron endonuclease
MYGIIYKATNISNDKIYIGKTTRDINKRISEHKSRAKSGLPNKFHSAIREFGINSFKWEVIDNANSETELDEKEMFYISKYDSYSTKGYNDCLGGKGTLGRIHTEEDKIKVVANREKEYRGEGHHMFGKTYDKHHRAKAVIQLSLNGEFIAEYSNIKECAEKTNCNKSHIVACCKSKLKQHKGYKWLYKEDWVGA